MSGAGQVRRAPGTGLAVLSLCLVQFVDVLGVTVVVTSLPAMLASLHAPASYASLIATGYAAFFGGLLMLGAAGRSVRPSPHDYREPRAVRGRRGAERHRQFRGGPDGRAMPARSPEDHRQPPTWPVPRPHAAV